MLLAYCSRYDTCKCYTFSYLHTLFCNFRLCVSEIIDILETEDDIIEGAIYICPPSNHMLSDADSDEEDAIVGDLNKLTGNQLRAEAQVECVRKTGTVLQSETIGGDESSEGEDNLPLSALASTSRNSKKVRSKQVKEQRKWKKIDLPEHQKRDWTRPDFLETNKAPVEWFELFYDDEILDLLVENSNKYAVFVGKPFDVTKEEIRLVLAIFLLSGYCVHARNRMYWDTGADTYHPGVANAISRSRFEQIMRFLHVCDNAALDAEDKFTKVRPLWVKLNEKWVKYWPQYNEVSIDESMIPYYGHHGTKQHIHGKPIRFGYKAWCMATRLGYLIQAIPYQGASTGNTNPDLGVGGSVVTSLVAKLPDNFPVHVYMDNFFTSFKLLTALKDAGHQGTGTIRANRVENAPFQPLQDMKKTARGTYEQITDEKSRVTLVRYNDNSVVTVASTCEGVTPLGSAQRWSSSEKKKVSIQQPACVQMYNRYMGGVDRLDQNIGCYRISINKKKWYWQLLMWPLNASMNNAFQLYRLSPAGLQKNHLDFLSFIRTVVVAYLGSYAPAARPIGRPLKPVCRKRRVPDDVRLDGAGHIIISSPTQIRCGRCHKNTTKKCRKCDVGCHANCFELFHS